MASGLEGIGSRVRSALRIPGLRAIDGLLGAALTACVGARHGLDRRRGGAADAASSARCATTSAARRSCGAGPAAAAVGPDPQRPGPASIRCRPSAGRPPTSPRRRAGSSARPGVRAAARERRAGDGHGLRAGRRGQRLGGRRPGWWSPTPTSSPARHDTTVQVGGVGAARPRDGGRLRRPRRHRGAAGAGPATPGTGARRAAARRDRGGDPRLSAGRRVRRRARPARSPDGRRHAGRLRQGHVLRSITALRGRVRPGNSGGPMVDAHGRVLATVFAAVTGTGAPAGSRSPTRSSARSWRSRAVSAAHRAG